MLPYRHTSSIPNQFKFYGIISTDTVLQLCTFAIRPYASKRKPLQTQTTTHKRKVDLKANKKKTERNGWKQRKMRQGTHPHTRTLVNRCLHPSFTCIWGKSISGCRSWAWAFRLAFIFYKPPRSRPDGCPLSWGASTRWRTRNNEQNFVAACSASLTFVKMFWPFQKDIRNMESLWKEVFFASPLDLTMPNSMTF